MEETIEVLKLCHQTENLDYRSKVNTMLKSMQIEYDQEIAKDSDNIIGKELKRDSLARILQKSKGNSKNIKMRASFGGNKWLKKKF